MDKLQLPAAFQTQMRELIGNEEYDVFEKAIDQDSRSSIRLNPFKKFKLQYQASPVPWSKQGYFLEERPSFTLDPSFHAGAYYVQEASSMFIEHILQSLQIPKGIYLDLAAAPGGKSTLLSTYLGHEGLLVANEVIQSRSQILKENIIKWGLGNTVVSNNDPEHFEPLEGFFDLVLVDAPCSGEGMFRKDPQARTEWSPDHVQLCSSRQKRIMDKAGALTAADGYLIYSTCTFNEAENEEMIRFMISEFSYEPVRIPLNETWNIRESQVKTEEGTFYSYRFFPHLVEGEGFFITVFKRPGDAFSLSPGKIKDFKHPFLKEVSPKESQALDEELGFQPSGQYYQLNDSYFRIESTWKAYFEKISQHLSIRYFGVELGKKQKNDWIPSAEWALSTLPKNGFNLLNVNLAQALDFLRKKDLEINEFPLGWVLICYQDLPLGWIKNLGGRSNNYYPKEWRIRTL
ncbi:MAG: tRNA/rRNA cytosine-C5-methylase [Algoriphagus sp.]|nr:tRNA/rRNA cytosine-C5-methylase [Algoriphagus sp.]